MRSFLLILSFALIFAAVNCEEEKKEELKDAPKEVSAWILIFRF